MNERPDKLNNHAIYLASTGNYKDAILCFKRAIQIEQNNSLLWYNLGVTYRDSGEMNKAYDSLEKAYSLNKENMEILEALVTVCFQLDMNAVANNLCSEALSRINDNPHLWNLIGVSFFKIENLEMAAECFEQAITLNPYYYDALYNLRDTYECTGNKNGVIECESKMKNLRPQ